jgi:hypothetical protein
LRVGDSSLAARAAHRQLRRGIPGPQLGINGSFLPVRLLPARQFLLGGRTFQPLLSLLLLILREQLLLGRTVLLYLGHKVNNYSPIEKANFRIRSMLKQEFPPLALSLSLSLSSPWKSLPRTPEEHMSKFREQHVSKNQGNMYSWNTHQLHGKGLLLLLRLLLLFLLESAPDLPQPLVMGRLHRPHVYIGVRAGRRRFHIRDDQLLVREQGWIRLAGDGEKAAAISLILSPLLFLKPAEPLLAGVLL